MMKSERQLIDVEEARGYVETFMADPIRACGITCGIS